MSIIEEMAQARHDAIAAGKRPTHWRITSEALMSVLSDSNNSGMSGLVYETGKDGQKAIFGLPIIRDATGTENGWLLEFSPVSDALREQELWEKIHEENEGHQRRMAPMMAELDAIQMRKAMRS